VLGPDGPADRPGGSGKAIGEVRFPDRGPQVRLRAAQSTPAKLHLSFVNPSIDGETAIGELPGGTVDRGDFVGEPTGEQDQLVLLGNNGAIVWRGHVVVVFPSRVVDAQLAAAELFGLTMEEVDKGNFSSRDYFRRVVAVAVEEVAVVAGSSLGFDAGNRKRFASPFLQNPG